MAHDVFISYSTQDKATADAICAALEQRNIRCWVAPRDILPGQTFSGAIVEAIDHARVLVLVFSDHSNNSEHVEREIQLAGDERIPILPFRITEVAPTASLRYFLGKQHWLDALSPPLERHIERLCDAVRSILQMTARDAVVESEAGESSQQAVTEIERTAPTSQQESPLAQRLNNMREATEQKQAQEYEKLQAKLGEEVETEDYERARDTVNAMLHLRPDDRDAQDAKALIEQEVEAKQSSQVARSQRTPAAERESKPARQAFRDKSVAKFQGHTNVVTCVVATSDGAQILSGSGDCTIKAWDSATGECLRTLRGHKALVSALAVTQDGNLALSASADNTIKLWDLGAGQCLSTLNGHKRGVNAIVVADTERLAVSGSWDKTLKVWDLENGKCLRTLTGHSGGIRSIAAGREGTRAISASEDNIIKVWDIKAGTCLRTIRGHSKSVVCVAMTADGMRLVSSGADLTRVWDLNTGTCMHEVHILPGEFALLPGDTLRIVAYSWITDSLNVYDAETSKLLRSFKNSGAPLRCVTVTEDGRLGISGSQDGTVTTWDLTEFVDKPSPSEGDVPSLGDLPPLSDFE